MRKTLSTATGAGAAVALALFASSPAGAANVVADAMVIATLCNNGSTINREMVGALVLSGALDLDETIRQSEVSMREALAAPLDPEERRALACAAASRTYGPDGTGVPNLIVIGSR